MHLQRLHPLDVSTPDGTRRRVVLDPSTMRVGDIAAAAGLDVRSGVAVDGVTHDVVTPAAAAGIRRGCTVAPPVARQRAGVVVLAAVCEAGPDVAHPVALEAGRHVVGRGERVTVRFHDAELEPHHVMLDVAPDATAVLTQLAGRVPVLVDGRPIDAPTPVVSGTLIEIGASRVRLQRPEPSVPAVRTDLATAHHDGDPWRSELVRRSRPPRVLAVAPAPPSAVREPAPSGAGSGVVGAVGVTMGLVASAAIAIALRQPMFVLFVAVGAVVSISTGIALRLSARRAARSARRERAALVAEHVRRLEGAAASARVEHLAWASTPAATVARPRSARTWERRTAHGDAFVVSLGTGDVRVGWALPTPSGDRWVAGELGHPRDDIAADVEEAAERAGWMHDVPLTADLGGRDRRCIALAGPGADAVARSLVLQLAVQAGPADWRLVAATSAADGAWAGWLPHTELDGHTPCVVDAHDAGALGAALTSPERDRRRRVVLTDRPQLLTSRTGPLREVLDDESGPPVTVILTIVDASHVPAACDSVLELGPRWRARWTADTSSGELPQRLHAAGVRADVAAAVARSLADLVDPEQADAGARLPGRLHVAELPGVPIGTDAVLAAWRRGGVDPPPAAIVGATEGAVVEVDLVRDGPHALIAGTTGSGKSELLRTLVVGLAARCSPDHLTFVLVDYKGGSTFDACAALPHTVGVVTDLDDGLAARALLSLDAELRRRERLLRAAGAADLTAYRATPGAPVLPRLVVVVDEFAALAAELPDFLRSLVAVAQRGRSLGMHLVLATQRPAGVVDDHVRANTALRIALRLHDPADSIDVVGDPVAATLSQRRPGRAVVRFGGAAPVVFQAASCTLPVPEGRDARTPGDLAAIVRDIAAAAALSGCAGAHRPWLEPLPVTLEAPLDDGAVGICDDPAAQAQPVLRWDRAANLALVGSLGSGTTTALRTVVAAAADAVPPAELHVYAIEASGAGGLDGVRVLAQCGAVVALHEHERLTRLLRRLTAAVGARRGGDHGPSIVLAVDGLGALRAALAEIDPVDGVAALDRLLADGPALGVTVAATMDPAAATSVLHRFGQRWVFHLDDAGDGPALGVPVAKVPPAIPGRVVVVPGALAAQLATLVPVPGTDVAGVPSAVEALPVVVRREDLVPTTADGHEDGRAAALAIGRRFDDLSTASLHVPGGEHVLVVGPPRSGRTSTLATLAAAWLDAHPGGRVLRHVRDLRSHVDSDRLLVIDDAERVGDDDGALLRAVEVHDERLTVMAAGRPDALRASYGTWIAHLRRSRLGIVMTGGIDVDGDVLGAVLPRRCPIASRPGLGWIVDGPTVVLAQLAVAAEDQLGSMP